MEVEGGWVGMAGGKQTEEPPSSPALLPSGSGERASAAATAVAMAARSGSIPSGRRSPR